MRSLWLVIVCAGCGATIDIGDQNAIIGDAPVEDLDAPPPVDAPRACAGGDAAMQAGDGSCLVRFNTPRTFVEAQAACVAFDAKLAVLTSAARDTTARTLVGLDVVFVGLTDAVSEGTFVWIDGTPLGFTNFATGEPNNAQDQFQEDCIAWVGARPGWDDRPCAPIAGVLVPGAYPYLCMFND